jgi:hypothetical protein
MRTSLLLLLTALANTLPAVTGTMRTRRFTSIRELDSLILALEDSSLCDTSIAAGGEGTTYIAYCDSGRVLVRTTRSTLAPCRWEQVSGLIWSSSVQLDGSSACSSPVIFELGVSGDESLLVAAWRRRANGLTYVKRSYLYPGVFPPQWSRPCVMASRSE